MIEQLTIIPRGFGGLVFDAVFEEDHTLELEVTDNPVETGVSITDHAYMKPYKVRITAGVTNTPLAVKNDGYGDGEGRTVAAFKALETLMRTREPFDVQTGLKLYENMLCVSVNTTQDVASANVMVFTAELREIIIVQTQAVTYPPRSSGKAANQAGKKKTQGEKQAKEETATTKKQSLAKRLSGAFGGGEVK